MQVVTTCEGHDSSPCSSSQLDSFHFMISVCPSASGVAQPVFFPGESFRLQGFCSAGSGWRPCVNYLSLPSLRPERIRRLSELTYLMFQGEDGRVYGVNSLPFPYRVLWS